MLDKNSNKNSNDSKPTTAPAVDVAALMARLEAAEKRAADAESKAALADKARVEAEAKSAPEVKITVGGQLYLSRIPGSSRGGVCIYADAAAWILTVGKAQVEAALRGGVAGVKPTWKHESMAKTYGCAVTPEAERAARKAAAKAKAAAKEAAKAPGAPAGTSAGPQARSAATPPAAPV